MWLSLLVSVERESEKDLNVWWDPGGFSRLTLRQTWKSTGYLGNLTDDVLRL